MEEMCRHSFKVKYEEAREGEVKQSVGNNTRALVSLEWEPAILLYQGIERLLRWRGVECKIE